MNVRVSMQRFPTKFPNEKEKHMSNFRGNSLHVARKTPC